MKTSSKFALIIFIIALIVIGAIAYPIVKQRYIELIKIDPVETTEPGNSDNTKDTSDIEEDIVTEPDDSEENADQNEGDSFLDILPQDCNNDCIAFEDEEDITYCKQTCGLLPISDVKEGCDALLDIERDYCLKDLAVSKSDPTTCDQIQDANIKTACKNRTLEDIVDEEIIKSRKGE